MIFSENRFPLFRIMLQEGLPGVRMIGPKKSAHFAQALSPFAPWHCSSRLPRRTPRSGSRSSSATTPMRSAEAEKAANDAAPYRRSSAARLRCGQGAGCRAPRHEPRAGRTRAQVGAGDTALFYFAGHGFAIDGTNYLLPVDVPSRARERKASSAKPLSRPAGCRPVRRRAPAP